MTNLIKLCITLSSLYLVKGMSLSFDKLFQDDLYHEDHLHRNLITLNLFKHRLPGNVLELLSTKMRLQLATHLWSPQSQNISAGQLALYTQGLKASCGDPHDFHGANLVRSLAATPTTSKFEAHLVDFSLCILSTSGPQFEELVGPRLRSIVEDEPTNMAMDTLAIRSLLLSCYSKLRPDNGHLRHDLNDLMAKILTKQMADGSFGGSVVTTALVFQASTEAVLPRLSFLWNRKAALDYLNTKSPEQLNALEAYYLIPAFHEPWSQIRCKEQDFQGPTMDARDEAKSILAPILAWMHGKTAEESQEPGKVNLTLSRWVNMEGNGTRVSLSVPRGSSLMHALKAAAKVHTDFTYDGIDSAQGFYVTTVGNLTERVDDKDHWTVHKVRASAEEKPVGARGQEETNEGSASTSSKASSSGGVVSKLMKYVFGG